MGKRTTHIALSASVALLAGLIALDRNTATPSAPAQGIGSPAPAATRQDGADRRPSPRDAKQIKATSRSFLAAYLPYTHNHPDALTKLPSATVEPGLLQQLLAAPPHGRPAPAAEIVARMAVERLTPRQAIVVADIQRTGARYAVALTLTRRAGQWTVTDTRPAG